jgi:hypothetical protein
MYSYLHTCMLKWLLYTYTYTFIIFQLLDVDSNPRFIWTESWKLEINLKVSYVEFIFMSVAVVDTHLFFWFFCYYCFLSTNLSSFYLPGCRLLLLLCCLVYVVCFSACVDGGIWIISSQIRFLLSVLYKVSSENGFGDRIKLGNADVGKQLWSMTIAYFHWHCKKWNLTLLKMLCLEQSQLCALQAMFRHIYVPPALQQLWALSYWSTLSERC